MAVSAEVVSVQTSVTALNTASVSGQRLTLSAAGDITLGDSVVTTTTGLVLGSTDSPLTVELAPGEVLFGVAGSATDMQVLRSGS